jgi:hypothetical protein
MHSVGSLITLEFEEKEEDKRKQRNQKTTPKGVTSEEGDEPSAKRARLEGDANGANSGAHEGDEDITDDDFEDPPEIEGDDIDEEEEEEDFQDAKDTMTEDAPDEEKPQAERDEALDGDGDSD